MLLPDGGRTLRATGGGPEAWEAMLGDYAHLQVELVPRAAAMVDLGVPDAGPERLPDRAADLLADDEALLLGRSGGLSVQLRDRIAAGLGTYTALCRELADGGVPFSLQHDDLHDANVFVTANGHRLFDWGDAVVAHPFLSLLVALRMAARALGAPYGHPVLLGLRDAYLRPWEEHGSPAHLRDQLDLALRVGPPQRALTWRRILRGIHPAVRTAWADDVPSWTAEHLEPGPLTARG